MLFDKEAKRVETRNRQAVPNDGRAVAIVKSFEDEGVVQLLNDANTRDGETSEKNPLPLRLAMNKKILPRSEAPKMLHKMEGDKFIVESLPHNTDEDQPKLAISIVETLPRKLFYATIVNVSKSPVILPKILRIRQLTEAPSMIAHLKNVLSVEFVNPYQFISGNKTRRNSFLSICK